MNKNSILILSALLASCATTSPYNLELAEKNTAVVKDTVFDPIFSIKPKSSTLKKINGKETSYTSFSNEIPAGEHEFFVNCQYFETSTLAYGNDQSIKVTLEKGHTYKLVPYLAFDKKEQRTTCVSILEDQTKI